HPSETALHSCAALRLRTRNRREQQHACRRSSDRFGPDHHRSVKAKTSIAGTSPAMTTPDKKSRQRPPFAAGKAPLVALAFEAFASKRLLYTLTSTLSQFSSVVLGLFIAAAHEQPLQPQDN